MPGALDFLWDSAPESVTGSQVSSSQMPDWYQEYIRGIAGRGVEVAGRGYTPYQGARLADFNPDQRASFDTVRGNQGAWRPSVGGALTAAGQIMPTATSGVTQANQYGQGAVTAASGAGTGDWTQNYQRYMSPYTSAVVDEIGRRGNQNLFQNVIPQLNNTFTGSGQFGSSRNAEYLGRGIRDAQLGITGEQARALESGYGTAAGIFGADANRNQQQQQMLTNANISAGQLSNAGAQIASSAADSAAARMGALGQLQQSLGSNDAASLGAIGGQQQQLQQQGNDVAYNEFLTQRDWDMNQLGALNSLVRGMQLPTTQATTGTTTSTGVGTSPLQWVNALFGMTQQQQPAARQP